MLALVAGEEQRRLTRGPGCSRERAGAVRGGSVGWPAVGEDLAHDDLVCELCDEAARAAAMRAREDLDGEDTSHAP